MAQVKTSELNVNNCYNTCNYNAGGYFPPKTTLLHNAFSKGNQIKKWLSSLEPQHRHQSLRNSRVDSVGDWFLGMNEFRVWSGRQGVPKQAVLFCYGDAGVGKTHIRSVTKLSRTSGYRITDGQQY